MMSLQKYFIFIHIPKTAGNSIQTALKPYSEDSFNQIDFDGVKYHKLGVNNSQYPQLGKHSLLKDYTKYFNVNKFFKIVSVRNPWDRMLSWYMFDNNGKEFNKTNFISFIKRMDPPELEMFNSQYEYICHEGKPNIDFIIKFENLQNDFDLLCDRLSIMRMKLFKLNPSKNSQMDYHNFYDEETKTLVNKLFKKDIEYFGYEF